MWNSSGCRCVLYGIRLEAEPDVWGGGDEPEQLFRGNERTAPEILPRIEKTGGGSEDFGANGYRESR